MSQFLACVGGKSMAGGWLSTARRAFHRGGRGAGREVDRSARLLSLRACAEDLKKGRADNVHDFPARGLYDDQMEDRW
jgi:hypothetical protein